MFQAHQLTKSYGRRTVLRPVSFCLPRGGCLGIVGENGSGKSTLLSILAQTCRPDSGTITYQGRSVLGDRRFLREKLGYVPQSSDLIPSLTARQQLSLWRSACAGPSELPGGAAEMLGLKELLPLKIEEMSGGMRQRVSIAMALSSSPEILIMDEATTGLDDGCREALLTWLEAYLRRGGRMVWCSHHPEEIQRLCGSVINLSERQSGH